MITVPPPSAARERILQHACQDVGAAAGREGDDDAQGAVREGRLCEGWSAPVALQASVAARIRRRMRFLSPLACRRGRGARAPPGGASIPALVGPRSRARSAACCRGPASPPARSIAAACARSWRGRWPGPRSRGWCRSRQQALDKGGRRHRAAEGGYQALQHLRRRPCRREQAVEAGEVEAAASSPARSASARGRPARARGPARRSPAAAAARP